MRFRHAVGFVPSAGPLSALFSSSPISASAEQRRRRVPRAIPSAMPKPGDVAVWQLRPANRSPYSIKLSVILLASFGERRPPCSAALASVPWNTPAIFSGQQDHAQLMTSSGRPKTGRRNDLVDHTNRPIIWPHHDFRHWVGFVSGRPSLRRSSAPLEPIWPCLAPLLGSSLPSSGVLATSIQLGGLPLVPTPDCQGTFTRYRSALPQWYRAAAAFDYTGRVKSLARIRRTQRQST
jgi:hypothetical protein